MRITIGAKLMIGFGSLLVILLTTGLVVNANVRTIDKELTEITTVEEPTSAAAYEMEINVIGTGLGVLKYLDTGDPRYRARVEKDEADFERFKAQYDRLAETSKGKELGKKVGVLYLEFKALGDTLMDTKDRQEAAFSIIAENFEKLDDIIDEKIQANIDLEGPDGFKKLLESSAMEADIAEVGTWLGNYLRTPKKEYKERIFDNANDVRDHMARFKKLRLTREERTKAGELEEVFDQTMLRTEEVLALNEDLQRGIQQFIGLREKLDVVLDEEIQVLTHKDLNLAKEDAHRSVGATRQVVVVMLIAGLLIGGGAAVAIGRGIAGPVAQLADGADKIGRGVLDHRIDVKTKDEIGELAAAFNQMAEKRQKAEEELQTSLDDKTLLLNEVNHRVKNNLQLISSMLSMSGRRTLSPEAIDVIRDCEARIQAMSLIHAELYASGDFKQINLGDMARKLSNHLIQLFGDKETRVEIRIESNSVAVGISRAIPFALAINELVTNALKHAFVGRAEGKMDIYITEVDSGRIRTVVQDDGVGIPTEVDVLNPPQSLGLMLVKDLVIDQLQGTIELDVGQGTTFSLEFPATVGKI